MGDPRKARKTYEGPRHPWQKSRIEEEKVLMRDFGLKNKKEIYKANSLVKSLINHYKKLNTSLTKQSEVEQQELLAKAKRFGFVGTDATAGDLLNLTVRAVLERRLQTVVVKQKLARTVRQARQFVVHQHIMVGDKVVDAPGYLVPLSEEHSMAFVGRSALGDESHPERTIVVPKKEEEKKEKSEDLETIETAKDVTPVEIKDEDEEKPAKAEEKPVEAAQ